MENFTHITQKLKQFQKKYYTNELIKGAILFFSLGALHFFATLFVEYFFWLNTNFRTVLFWSFVLVELFLFIRFIGFPIFKLLGLKKGISLEHSSKIIGEHFSEVNDKLVNFLQLRQRNTDSELLLASIDQKAKELQPIPFVKAVNFKKNIKYLKYTAFPIVVWLLILIVGDKGFFNQSIERVVNYKTTYIPPAPFSFTLKNNTLKVIQGKSLEVIFSVDGNIVPDEAIIVFNEEEYYLSNSGQGLFTYTFLDIQKPFLFHVKSNTVQSRIYAVDVIKTPTINTIEMQLEYPKYINKNNETIKNAGNVTVPEGTTIKWLINTQETTSVDFLSKDKRESFASTSSNSFHLSKQILKPLRYHIVSSNTELKDYEDLEFRVNVIKDEFPAIKVTSNIDSITRGEASFFGQISDDYGFKKLEFVYYDVNRPNEKKSITLPIKKSILQNFSLEIPNNHIAIQEGISYEMYFQVVDNDVFNNFKTTKSKIFSYRKKTKTEVEDEILQQQKSAINSLETTLDNQRKEQKNLKELSNELQKKKSANWNDKKKLDNLIKRQQQYDKMMQRQSEKLKENLLEKEEINPILKEKKEHLQKRIEELRNSDKQKKLLEELEKIADKLNKEDLVKKAKELALQNKQKERSLTRTLELVKRFYVEQKAAQIANKLEELSKKQESLSKKENNTSEKQKEISKEFNELKNEIDELNKDNQNLKNPMELPDVDDEKESISAEQSKAEKNLNNKKQKQARQNQQNAYKKMKQMSSKMQQSLMEMQANMIDENIEDLRKILENLVTFSYQQEELLKIFFGLTTTHPSFGKSLKKQNTLKTYFEHIDDSLFVLSMRLPKLSSKIQEDLGEALYNLDESLNNFTENSFNNGLANQRYILTATNNLADYLSTILTNMQNSMSMGKASGKKKSNGFSLPDIIKKQGELSKQMQKGLQKSQNKGNEKNGKKTGEKPGDKKGNKTSENVDGKQGNKQGNSNEGQNNELDGELFEIYKQQSLLRQQLEEQLQNQIGSESPPNSNAKKVLQTMEELENKILENGFTVETLTKMKQLNYELLKLEKAQLQQGKDKKRKSTLNTNQYQKASIKDLEIKKQYFNQLEILNRQSLPLQKNYKEKVRSYFTNEIK